MESILSIGIILIVISLVAYFFYSFKETHEEKAQREHQESLRHENYLKLIEGAKVKIIDGFHENVDVYGIISKKVIFNSWECDHALIYFKVDVYKGNEKVATKDFFDQQLKYIGDQ